MSNQERVYTGGELPIPFTGNRNVDVREWVEKPSEQMQRMVGDLTNPENITFERSQVLWALNISHYTTKAINGAEGMSPIDERYVSNAFGFVADNLAQMGILTSKDSETLRQMHRSMEELTSEVDGHLKGNLPSSLRVFLPR